MKWNKLTAIFALGAVVAAFGVNAQTEEEEDEQEQAVGLDRVQVTARRVEEAVLEVPRAVSAFSSEDLRNLQAEQLDDLQNAIPNVNIAQGRASASSINAFIRGVGQPDALQTFDPAVGVYIDDVFLSRIQGGLLNLYDVERIEVLRGPQGTLYGRNSPGGAIKVVTRTPTQDFQAIAEARVGNFGRRTGQFYIAGGVADNVALSVAGMHTRLDGFVEDPVTGRDFNDDDSDSLRAKLHFTPTPDFSLTIGADYTRQRNAASLGQQVAPLISVDLATGEIVPRFIPPGEKFDFRTRTNLEPDQGQELDHWGITVQADWQIDPSWSLISITGYRELETDFWIEFDNTELSMTEALVALDQDQFSQELQVHYNNGHNFRAVGGLFYLNEQVPSEQIAIADDFLLFFGAPLDFLRTIDDDLETDSYAAFAHLTWDFAPRWSLSAGGRYTRDEKDYFRTTSTFSDAFPPLDGTFTFEDSGDWSEFTPEASIRFTPVDNLMVYGSWAEGFKSGGFNGRANTAADVSEFAPETVTTFEIGLKADFWDRRVNTSVAIFRSDYDDFQARVADPEELASFPVINAGELRIDGVEFEASAVLPTDTVLSTQIGYLDARYREFIDARFPDADRSDDEVPFSPDWTLRFAALQNVHLNNGGTLVFGGDAAFRDETYLSVDNQPGLVQDAFWLFNAFARYQTPSRQWEFSAGIRNIGDKVYKVDAFEFSSVGNIQGAFFGAPRTWYGAVRFNY